MNVSKHLTGLLVAGLLTVTAGAGLSGCDDVGNTDLPFQDETTQEEVTGGETVSDAEVTVESDSADDAEVTAEPDTQPTVEQDSTPTTDTLPEEKPSHEHRFGEWIVCEAATCTAQGRQERTCDCGHIQQQAISKIAHTPGEWVVDDAGTCGGQGKRHATCTVCGQIAKTETFTNTNTHQYADRVCTRCGIPLASEGLDFIRNDDGRTFSVSGMGTCEDSILMIPATTPTGGKVTGIAECAISGKQEQIILPDSIETVATGAISCDRFCRITVGKNAKLEAGAIELYGGGEVTYLSSRPYAAEMLTVGSENGARLSVVQAGGTSRLTETEDGYTFMSLNGQQYLVDYRGEARDLVLPATHAGVPYHMAARALAYTDIDSVDMGDGVLTVGEGAFLGSQVATVEWSTAATTVPMFCLSGCARLSTFTVPDSVQIIEAQAFDQCGLRSLSIGTGVTSIGTYAFGSCNIETLYYNAISATCSRFAFSSVKQVTVGNQVVSLDAEFMYKKTALQTLLFEEGSRCQIVRGFTGTGISEVTIPASATDIRGAFGECTSLTRVNFEAVNCTEAANAFKGSGSIALYVDKAVTILAADMFAGCTLTEMVFAEDCVCRYVGDTFAARLPASVTLNRSMQHPGALVRVATLTVHPDNPYIKIVDDCVIDLPNSTLLYARTENFVVPADGTVTTVAAGAFDLSTITSLYLPDAIETIEEGAIRCGNLQAISLPFLGRSRTQEQYLVYVFGREQYSGGESVSITPPDTGISCQYYVPKNLTKVVIRCETLTTQLRGLTKLTSLHFAATVTGVDQNALTWCGANLSTVRYEHTDEVWETLTASGFLAPCRYGLDVGPA